MKTDIKPNLFKQFLLASIVLKLCLIFTFSSDYSSKLFYPFLTSISLKNLNPWQLFYENNLLDSFPYHGLMLYLLAPFAYLGKILGIEAIIKIPSLIADFLVLILLLRLFPNKEKNVYFYYFLNPIIIYAIYIHSQLDIIPTALLFSSIYFLVIDKQKISAIFFGLALATKSHVIVALPLIIFYLFKKNQLITIIKYLISSFAILFLIDLPFLFSPGFIKMVLLNPKQSLLFDTFYSVGTLKILLPIAAILIVYLHFFNQNKVNQDLLFFYFGLLFTATVFFIYPAPAWYVWIIPFLSIYFIQNKNQKKSILLYSLFSLAYLSFFIFFYESEYKDIIFLNTYIDSKIDNENLRNLFFTLLECSILALLYAFYKYGIKSNAIYKKQTNLSIGIGGDSGAGKSTLVKNLKALLGNQLLQIEGDGEHKWERGDTKWETFTHLDPKANYIHKQADIIYELKHNRTTFRSEYDHNTGKLTEAKKIEPKEFIVIAGLHPFYLPKLRKNIDLKIYLDTDENLRRHWKILRDTKKRGYSLEKILKQIEERMEDAKKYIYPQKHFSDLIIRFFSVNAFEIGSENAKIDIGLKITFDANLHIETILSELNCDFIWDYNDDLKSQYIELKTIPKVNFKNIALNTIDNLNEIVAQNVSWDIGYNGLIQLISLKMISEKLKNDKE